MKRASERQITKDDLADDEQQDTPQGFEKAPPEVLAKRKILKVRRTPNIRMAPTSNANAFAALSNAAAPTVAPVSAAKPVSTEEKPEQEKIAKPPSVSAQEPVVKSPVDPSIVEPKASEAETKSNQTEEEKPKERKPSEEYASKPSIPEDGLKGEANTHDATNKIAQQSVAAPTSTLHAASGGSGATPSPPAVAGTQKAGTEDLDNANNVTTNATTNGTSNGLPKPAILFGGTAPSGVSFASAAKAENNPFGFMSAVPGPPLPVESPTKSEFKQTKTETGEEKEEELFRTRAKLYSLEQNVDNMRWKERGVGTFKLNKHEESQKVRLLMRTEATLRVVLNTSLFPQFRVDRATERSIRFQGFDPDKPENEKGTSYLLRLSTKDATEDLVAAIIKHKGEPEKN